MANYYLDFVGLNTFIYEPVGWSPNDQIGGNDVQGSETKNYNYTEVLHPSVTQNYIGYNFILNNYTFSKNWLFSHELPTTASFFPALMIHRNGPYGYPMWKQTRIGQNPLTRRQIKNNIFTHVVEPGEEFEFKSSNIVRYAKRRYGAIESYDEMCLTSRFSPINISYKDATAPESNFNIKISVGNNIQHFNTEKLDVYYGIYSCEDKQYNKVKKLYLNGAYNDSTSRIDEVDYLTYSETIYPQAKYTYKSYIRQRTNFQFDWKDSESERYRTEKFHFFEVGSGSTTQQIEDNRFITQSAWPLDVSSDWATRDDDFLQNHHGYRINVVATAPANHKDFGILQNSVSRYNYLVGGLSLAGLTDTSAWIKPGIMYSYHHMQHHSKSVCNPTGMLIEGINYGTSMGHIREISIPCGETKWEANDTRQILNSNFEYVSASRNPFYNNYNDYVNDIRIKYKNYSVIPEYRSSLFVKENIVGTGINKYDLFQITGGLSNTTDSDKDNFYKIFSNSDFLKHFDVIRGEHKELLDIDEITLSCKVAMKFLPYNGFYPAQRTVDLAKAFYSDVQGRIKYSQGSVSTREQANAINNIMTPLFAPGVLFNSIKSGLACDYAVITGSTLDKNYQKRDDGLGDEYEFKALDNFEDAGEDILFNDRIPFRALIEPQKYLQNKTLVSQIPSLYGNLSASARWDGNGAANYRLMAHNFLSEVPEFFLKNKTFTNIASLPSNDPKFGNFSRKSVYFMRVRLYKTTDGHASSEQNPTVPSTDFQAPQNLPIVSGGAPENFTMYSRPSAFGPPMDLAWVSSGGRSGSMKTEIGENYVFTPPYYYGSGFADIKFEPEETKKYTLNEILTLATASYYRNFGPTNVIASGFKNALINRVAMHNDSSLNLFGVGKVKSDGITVDNNDADAQWVIQPWFECPMLNFNHLSSSQSVTLPLEGSQSVTRGMWHQYGRIEKDPEKGIFMSVEKIPDSWHLNAIQTGFKMKPLGTTGAAVLVSGSAEKRVRNLAKELGFEEKPRKLGTLATTKKVKEAVVAVPFVDVDGERKFFKLDDQYIPIMEQFYKGKLDPSQFTGYSEHVVKLFNQMKTYIFPPNMDFINNRDIQPFAMYVFEFEHTFDQQDLADMWQNLPPKLSYQFKSATSTITHKHLRQELLGGGENFYQDITNIADKPALGEFPDRLRWMVFKVKQRAETNYYKKIIGELKGNVAVDNETGETSPDRGVNPMGVTTPSGDILYQYNWPYDFFSMIELVNIEASVTMKNPNYNPNQLTLTTAPVSNPAIINMATDPIGTQQAINASIAGTTELTEESRRYVSAAGATIVTYSDGSTKTVSGDQT